MSYYRIKYSRIKYVKHIDKKTPIKKVPFCLSNISAKKILQADMRLLPINVPPCCHIAQTSLKFLIGGGSFMFSLDITQAEQLTFSFVFRIMHD